MVSRLRNQVKQQLRQGLEQAIEERVGFHPSQFSLTRQQTAMGRDSTVAWMQRSGIQEFHCPGWHPGYKGLVVDLTIVTTLGRVEPSARPVFLWGGKRGRSYF